jgi:hypothetical protein
MNLWVRTMNDLEPNMIAKTPPARLRWKLILPGIGIWLVTVIAGMGILADYANLAGPAGNAPHQTADFIAGTPGHFQLLMFVHPRCPCTLASVNELAKIMARSSGMCDAAVYFIRPESVTEEWVHGATWNAAAKIPGVRAVIDYKGVASARYGAKTSGDVLLYDSSGQLRFHGGITGARGHEGDNVGESAVISLILRGSSNVDNSPVFGCGLQSESVARGR